ncbi:phage portal protein [Nocardiopsis sp. NRRL B-16309]|uniref:phage portal protein n=1 Tax=Nocardiopsis sp. NRRL B-16309 TaxID=1519494 RepID=UPI000A8CF1E5|nr:phage portal protein [Nocardiopsis sp. NRRL B-16309]
MPLPDSSEPWPPASTEKPRALYDAWGAWYSGDPDQLSAYYGGTGNHNRLSPQPRPSQYRGGVVGTVARWFWGAPPDPDQLPDRLHVPLASDISSTSADLLFGEAPTLAVDEQGENKPTQDRLDWLMTEGGMHAALLEAGEIASAYGGVFLRASWDKQVADHPLVDAIAPDCAAPEWRSGRLVAVTLWKVLEERDDNSVVRHLERHEPGVVYHGLYEGSRDALGRKLPLADREETKGFAVNGQGGIPTGAKRLAVVYIPNMRPHRRIRGTPLGRSDYSGVEHLMDALDETWSSLIRDIDLGKARLIIPDSFLDVHGRGQASSFASERKAFTPVKGLQGAGDKFTDMIEQVQFAIRVDEHIAAATAFTEQIVRGGGYSAQTFGESGDLAITATEVQHRERRSFSTRGRKIGYITPELASFSETVLEMDAANFRTKGVVPQRPTIEWPDGVQDAPEATARTIQMLDSARALSDETKVRMAHKDWDDEQIAKEVKRLKDENPPVDIRAGAGLVNGQDDAPPDDAPEEDSPPERDE